MKASRIAGSGLVILLGIVGVGVYAFVLGGGGGVGGATLNVTSVNVGLNDDISSDVQGSGDGVTTCTAVGPPPDHLSVRIRGTVDDGHSGRYTDSNTYDLVVRVGDGTGSRRVRVFDGERQEFREIVLVEDDESGTPGEKVTVTVSLVRGETTYDTVTRTVRATERNLRCSDDSG